MNKSKCSKTQRICLWSRYLQPRRVCSCSLVAVLYLAAVWPADRLFLRCLFSFFLCLFVPSASGPELLYIIQHVSSARVLTGLFYLIMQISCLHVMPLLRSHVRRVVFPSANMGTVPGRRRLGFCCFGSFIYREVQHFWAASDMTSHSYQSRV